MIRGRHRRPRIRLPVGTSGARGYTLIELLFVASLIAILAGITIPQITVGLDRSRARAAARYLAGQMAYARTHAVGKGTTVALRFEPDAAGTALSFVVDGNRNGVRLREIEAGVDRPLQPAVRLEHQFPGVVIGVPDGSGDRPVQLGGTQLLSFTPAGTATSGSIHILGRDGSQFSVRVLGVTARVRLLRFDAVSRAWVDSF